MTWLLGLVGSRLGRLVASVLAVMASILAVFKLGQRDQKKQQEIDNLKDYVEKREAIDEVPVNDNVDDALDRLRDNDSLRD